MSRRLSSLILLTTILATSIVTVDTRSASANSVCQQYPSMCGYPNPDGRTPTSWNMSPESLEQEIRQGKATVDTYITLGYMYWQMKKFKLSEARYQRALKLARDGKDRNKQATVLAGLGDVRVSVGKIEKAVIYLKRSHRIFSKIGNKKFAAVIAQRLREVQKI